MDKIKHGHATQVVAPKEAASEQDYKRYLERRARRDGRTPEADKLRAIPQSLHYKHAARRVKNERRVVPVDELRQQPGHVKLSSTERNRRKRERRKRRNK